MESLFEITFKPFKDMLSTLNKFDLTFENALEFDLETLKFVYKEYDEKEIIDFWNALRCYKNESNEKPQDQLFEMTFKPFQDILNTLKNFEITFENTLELEFDIIKSVLEEYDEKSITDFWNALQNYKNESNVRPKEISNNPIIKFFMKKRYHTQDLQSLISKIIGKHECLSLDELLSNSKEKLSELSLLDPSDDDQTTKFILICELESFFYKNTHSLNENENNNNSHNHEFFDDLVAAFIRKNMSLAKISELAKQKKLDLFIFFSFSHFDETLPKPFFEYLDKENITFSQLKNFSKEEFKNYGLDENDIELLSIASDNAKQCSLRRFEFWELGYDFFKYICSQRLSFKDIDSINEEEFWKTTPVKPNDKIFKLLKQKSEFEVFLDEIKISLPEDPKLKALKYIDLNTLKT